MRLLSSFLNNFKKLFGMLAGPNAFPAFSELIIDVTSSYPLVEMLKFLQQVLKVSLKNGNLV